MSIRTTLSAIVLIILAGCAQPDPPVEGAVQSGDVLSPRLHFPENWKAGKRTAFATYVEVSREGHAKPFDLKDDCVPEGSLGVKGRLTFFVGDEKLEEPLTLIFIHEC